MRTEQEIRRLLGELESHARMRRIIAELSSTVGIVPACNNDLLVFETIRETLRHVLEEESCLDKVAEAIRK